MRRRLAYFSRQVRKLSLYFAVPALSALAPLLVIPAITSQYGAGGWAVVAIAVSLGAAASVVAELGWGVVGPQQIARDPEGSAALYELSLASKLISVAALAPLAAIAAALLVPSYSVGAALVAVGAVGAALSPAWYFIGKGRPLMVLVTDTLPKIAVSILAAWALLAGAPLETYGLALIAASVVGYGFAVVFGRLPAWPPPAAFLASPSVIRRQLVVIVGRTISIFYTTLPTAILGAVNVGAVATFSAVDRPMRMGLGILGGIPSRLQSWVGVPDRLVARRRSKISLLMNAVLGLVAGATYTVLAPFAVAVLFSGTIVLDVPLAALGGLIAALICTSRGLGLALVAADSANSITGAILVSAVVGSVSLVWFGAVWGAAGALVAVAMAEAVGILALSFLLLRAWKANPLAGG